MRAGLSCIVTDAHLASAESQALEIQSLCIGWADVFFHIIDVLKMVCLQQSLLQGVFPDYLYPGRFLPFFVFCSTLHRIWNEHSQTFSITYIVVLIKNLCGTGKIQHDFLGRLISKIMKGLCIQTEKITTHNLSFQKYHFCENIEFQTFPGC